MSIKSRVMVRHKWLRSPWFRAPPKELFLHLFVSMGQNLFWKSSILFFKNLLYIYYPIFHCSLYCRAVYDAERLIFHDSFFHPSRNKKYIVGYFSVVHSTTLHSTSIPKLRFILKRGLYYKKLFWALKSTVYNWEWFQIKRGL